MMEVTREMNFIGVMKIKNDGSSPRNELHRGNEVQNDGSTPKNELHRGNEDQK